MCELISLRAAIILLATIRLDRLFTVEGKFWDVISSSTTSDLIIILCSAPFKVPSA